MKPQRILACVLTPDEKELVLYQRGDVFQIDVDGYDLMGSRAHGSEEVLASLALGALGDGRQRGPLRILVGGFGMGFTLRATLLALDALGTRQLAVVEVAEVFQAVVDWNVAYLGQLAGHPIRDPRVVVTVGDVAGCFLEPDPLYDAVLLDVDNGPQALTLESNDALYSDRGLARIHRALTPGGVLAVWSSFPDDAFTHRFRRAGFEVGIHRVRARPGEPGRSGKGQRNVVFLGKKP
jgi:spermidine synthase